MLANNRYVLITPAKNEAEYIARTIESVLSQSHLPQKWIIVNDCSTDSTAEIVKKYSKEYCNIEMINILDSEMRNFGGKVRAFQKGYEKLKNIKYSFIGNLDADVSFDNSYYEDILNKFLENHQLGIAGGIIVEKDHGKIIEQNIAVNSVAGAVQLFRRECYEDIGGYIPLRYGGIDAAAEIMARMKAWEVRTYPEFKVYHHRRVATGGRNCLHTRFLMGYTNYLLGYHPLFQLFSSLYRFKDKPFLLGSITSILGYCWAFLKKGGKGVKMPKEAVQYLRKEQLQRLKTEMVRGKRI